MGWCCWRFAWCVICVNACHHHTCVRSVDGRSHCLIHMAMAPWDLLCACVFHSTSAIVSAAEQLNLQEHLVNGATIHFAGDVEGHIGKVALVGCCVLVAITCGLVLVGAVLGGARMHTHCAPSDQG